MILLAIDTSGKQGSIALARTMDGEPSPSNLALLEVVPLEGGTFSAQLVPQISALLQRHGLTKKDLGALAVASGPGSFTGLRVGLAATKALTEVLGIPVVAVSLLHALAKSSSRAGRIIAVLDAGRSEVYVGEYDVAEKPSSTVERLVSRQELMDGTFNAIVTSDPAIAEAARAAGLPVELVKYPGSVAVMRIGWEKLMCGETITSEALEANYSRHSDAEIFAKK